MLECDLCALYEFGALLIPTDCNGILTNLLSISTEHPSNDIADRRLVFLGLTFTAITERSNIDADTRGVRVQFEKSSAAFGCAPSPLHLSSQTPIVPSSCPVNNSEQSSLMSRHVSDCVYMIYYTSYIPTFPQL